MKSTRWTDDEEKQLLELRDNLRLGWDGVEARMPGRTVEACKLRYYYYLRDRNRACKRKHRPGGHGPKARRQVAPLPPPAPKPRPVKVAPAPRVKAAAPPKSQPQIFQALAEPATGRARRLMVPLAVDILQRVQTQGLTARHLRRSAAWALGAR